MDDHDEDASIHTFEVSMEVANKGLFNCCISIYIKISYVKL